MKENREFTQEEKEVWLKNKIEYLAGVLKDSFMFFAVTLFTKDRPKDLTLKDIMVRAFSTDNELKNNIVGQLLRAGITQAEIDEIFVLFGANKNDDDVEVRKEGGAPELSGHSHIYGDLGLGKD